MELWKTDAIDSAWLQTRAMATIQRNYMTAQTHVDIWIAVDDVIDQQKDLICYSKINVKWIAVGVFCQLVIETPLWVRAN